MRRLIRAGRLGNFRQPLAGLGVTYLGHATDNGCSPFLETVPVWRRPKYDRFQMILSQQCKPCQQCKFMARCYFSDGIFLK